MIFSYPLSLNSDISIENTISLKKNQVILSPRKRILPLFSKSITLLILYVLPLLFIFLHISFDITDNGRIVYQNLWRGDIFTLQYYDIIILQRHPFFYSERLVLILSSQGKKRTKMRDFGRKTEREESKFGGFSLHQIMSSF